MSGSALLARLERSSDKAGATLAIVAPKIGGVTLAKGKKIAADQALSSAPSDKLDRVGQRLLSHP